MVTLYVEGRKVEWADAGRVLGESPTPARNIELHDEAGHAVTRLVMEPITPRDDDPDWVKAITPEAIEQAMKGPFMTLEEFRNEADQPIIARDDDPDWVKAITPEEIERRLREPGFTFEEVKKRLGWE